MAQGVLTPFEGGGAILKRRLIVLVIVLLGVTVTLAGYALQSLGAHMVSVRLEAMAATRGAQLQWRTLELSWGEIRLRDFRVVHPRQSLRVEELVGTLDLGALFDGRIRLETLRLIRPIGRLNLAELEKNNPIRTGGQPMGEGSHWSESIPLVEVRKPRFSVVAPKGFVIAQIEGETFNMRPKGSGLVFSGLGTIEASGRVSNPLLLEGELDFESRSFNAVLRGQENESLFSGEAQGNAGFGLGKAAVAWKNGAGVLTLEDLRVNRMRGQFMAPRFELFVGDNMLRARATGAVLAVTPGRGIPRVLTEVASAAVGSGFLTNVLSRLDLELMNMSIDYPGLPRLSGFHLVWSGSDLDLRGDLAGGELRLGASWPRGWTRPEFLFLDAEGIELGAILGVAITKDERAPARRRRLEGRIDASLVILPVGSGTGLPLGDGHAMVEGLVRWRDGMVHVDGISPDPITELNLEVSARGEGGRLPGWIDLQGNLSIGEISLDWRTRLEDPEGDPVFHLDIDGRRMKCQDALAALPKGLLGPYERAKARGRVAPRVRFRWPIHRSKRLKLTFNDVVAACTIQELRIKRRGQPTVRQGKSRAPGLDDVQWLNEPFSLKVKEGVVGDEPVWVGPEVEDYVPIAELPVFVGAAAFLTEEINFNMNRPLDPGLILRALKLNLDRGRFVYGGSTVTQQLVKNLFLTRQKSLARKVREILVASRITQEVSRDRVLELYLNCIEFGPDVYGIGAAARFYFGKDARMLTPREAVFLAMLKPSPKRGADMMRRGRTPAASYWIDRAEQIFHRLVKKGYLSAEVAEAQRPYDIHWQNGIYAGR